MSGIEIQENFAFYVNLIYVFISRIEINFPMKRMSSLWEEYGFSLAAIQIRLIRQINT